MTIKINTFHYSHTPWLFRLSASSGVAPNWSHDGPMFQAMEKQFGATVPIYEYLALQGTSHRFRYATSQHMPTPWRLQRIPFYAFSANSPQPPGTIPLYEHHTQSPWRYRLSTSKQIQNWVYDRIVCYVYPTDMELECEVESIHYKLLSPPSTTRPVDIISNEIIDNQSSSATLSETVSNTIQKTSSFTFSLQETLTVGAKATVSAAIPFVVGGNVDVSASVALQAGESWTDSIQKSYGISTTVTVPPLSSVSVHAHLDWVDNISSPFDMSVKVTGAYAGGSKKLSADAIKALIENTGFQGTIIATSGSHAVIASIKGSFTGSYGVNTAVTVEDI